MDGKWVISGLMGFTAIFGTALWYSQNFAYYRDVTDVNTVSAFGETLAVSNYRGIDADTSPLKIRACFDVDWEYSAYEEFKEKGEPLITPFWFTCFDATQLGADIEAGKAIVLRAAYNDIFGFSRYIARYPDGRAYMWRQINSCGEAQFAGEKLPAECGDPDAKLGEERGAKLPADMVPAAQTGREIVVALNNDGRGFVGHQRNQEIAE